MQLPIKLHPVQAFGNDEGVIWASSFVFPLARAREAASVIKDLATANLMMIMAPPPARKPCLVIVPRYTGNPDDAIEAYKVIFDPKLIVANGAVVSIQNASDVREAPAAERGLNALVLSGSTDLIKKLFFKPLIYGQR